MTGFSERLLPALAIYVVSHSVVFTLASWAVLHVLFSFDSIWALVCGLASAMVVISVEWILGPRIVSAMFRPRWVDGGEDPMLWSLAEGEAERAGVGLGRIGVLDFEVPNALVIFSVMGRPTVFLTRGLLIGSTYVETRAVVAYLMGCSRSGVLGLATALSGLIIISNRIASGYIEGRLEERPIGLPSIILAGWGYLLFALASPVASLACREMSAYGEEFSVRQTGSPSGLVTALLKVAADLAERPSDALRKACAPIKGLMFIDPTNQLRGSSSVNYAAKKYDIDLARLLGHELEKARDLERPEPHIFERYRVHSDLPERLEHAVETWKEARASP
jgi:Zn-dependent protease with chaperone function